MPLRPRFLSLAQRDALGDEVSDARWTVKGDECGRWKGAQAKRCHVGGEVGDGAGWEQRVCAEKRVSRSVGSQDGMMTDAS
mmetsp:Transcript_16158/g.36959  ORF Transcript_16158/g.36959 Transcript_16158/m.36959 type:complete len:81 (+) Transcript_16158:239-481(+)